jgi:hypothetical protein
VTSAAAADAPAPAPAPLTAAAAPRAGWSPRSDSSAGSDRSREPLVARWRRGDEAASRAGAAEVAVPLATALNAAAGARVPVEARVPMEALAPRLLQRKRSFSSDTGTPGDKRGEERTLSRKSPDMSAAAPASSATSSSSRKDSSQAPRPARKGVRLFRALGALVRMAVSNAATLAAIGALAAPIALLAGVRSGVINSGTVKNYGLEGAFDWERHDGMARRAIEALRAAVPQPPPHDAQAPAPAQSDWLRFPETGRRWGEGLAALTRQQLSVAQGEREPSAPGLVDVAVQWWGGLRSAAAPLWDGARGSGASAAAWAVQQVAAWSRRGDAGAASSGADSAGPASAGAGAGAAGGLSADEVEELRRYRMLAERDRKQHQHQHKEHHQQQPAHGLPAVVAKVGAIPAALGRLQDSVVEWLSGAGAAPGLAGASARPGNAIADTPGTGPVAGSEPLGPGPGELARAAAAAAGERAAATLIAVKERLSDAASLPGALVEELQQRLSQPLGKSAPAKVRAVASGREALLEQAVLRRRLALEMPALQVDPGGKLDRVQRMLDGLGLPYDPEIPWAG